MKFLIENLSKLYSNQIIADVISACLAIFVILSTVKLIAPNIHAHGYILSWLIIFIPIIVVALIHIVPILIAIFTLIRRKNGNKRKTT